MDGKIHRDVADHPRREMRALAPAREEPTQGPPLRWTPPVHVAKFHCHTPTAPPPACASAGKGADTHTTLGQCTCPTDRGTGAPRFPRIGSPPPLPKIWRAGGLQPGGLGQGWIQ